MWIAIWIALFEKELINMNMRMKEREEQRAWQRAA
jgi:hypothetical protein